MTTTLAALNGRPQRKQLSAQLNRLDDIIDTLADGLPDAVGDAVRTGVQTALQQLLVETLTNPETLALLRAALGPRVAAPPLGVEPVPAAVTRESFWTRCRRKLAIRSRSLKDVAVRGIETGKAAVRETRGFVGRTVERVRAFRRGLDIAWQLKKAALIGLGIGAAVVAVSLASHPLAAVLSGVGAATSAFALQVGLWFRKTARQMIA